MNRLLSSPIDKSKVQKIYWLLLILFCMVPVLLNTAVLIPIYASLEADVVFKGSALSSIIKYAQELLDLLAFCASYSLMIFSMLLLTGVQTRLTVIFYALLFLAQIPLKLLINVFIYGSLGNGTQITVDVIYLLVYFALQMLQLFFVYLFSRADSGKYKQYVASLDSAKNPTNDTPKKILPLSRLFNWNNPLQLTAAKMSILVFAIKIFTRIVSDVTYGAPKSAGEVLIMCAYYLSDVIYGILAYLIGLFMFTLI